MFCDEEGSMYKVFCILKNSGCLEEKHLCTSVASWTSHLFYIHFYLKEQLIGHGYLDLGICRYFLKNNQDRLVTSRTTSITCCK